MSTSLLPVCANRCCLSALIDRLCGVVLLANWACPIHAEAFCAGELFVWTDGTPTDYEAWEGRGPGNYQGWMRGRGCDPEDRDARMDCVEAWEQGTSWSAKYPCSLVVAVLPKSNRHEIHSRTD